MHVTISNLEFMYIDRHLICDVNLLKLIVLASVQGRDILTGVQERDTLSCVQEQDILACVKEQDVEQ